MKYKTFYTKVNQQNTGVTTVEEQLCDFVNSQNCTTVISINYFGASHVVLYYK